MKAREGTRGRVIEGDRQLEKEREKGIGAKKWLMIKNLQKKTLIPVSYCQKPVLSAKNSIVTLLLSMKKCGISKQI